MDKITVEGDGSWNGTDVMVNGTKVAYDELQIRITPTVTICVLDGIKVHLTKILLTGIYGVIGLGEFVNTKVFFNDGGEYVNLRGIDSFTVVVSRRDHPRFYIEGVYLPNIVEEKEEERTEEKVGEEVRQSEG